MATLADLEKNLISFVSLFLLVYYKICCVTCMLHVFDMQYMTCDVMNAEPENLLHCI